MKLITKLVAAGTSMLILTMSIASAASAQNVQPLPGIGQGQEQQAQNGSFRAGNQGNHFGQIKNKVKQVKDHWGTLSLEEKKELMTEKIDRTIEQLNTKLEAVSANEDIDEEIKNQIINLINEQLNALPSFKEQVMAAVDEEALNAVMESMREHAQKMMEFMKENRPNKEDMKEKWDNLSFEEKQAMILEKLTNAEENLNERLEQIADTKAQVSAATSDEELENLMQELWPKKPGKKGQGNFPPGQRPGNPGQGQ